MFLRLLEFAVLTFSPKKVFHYLGRKWHEKFDGEVQTHYKSVREPGACVKHYMRNNWLKMYDKFGLILRVETVINQPGEFKVFRECWHRDGSKSLGWYPMCKGVGNFHHYQSHALACNLRYLEALAAVEDPAPAYDDLRTLTERQRDKGAAMRASIPPERRRPVCSPLCWRVITSPKVFATKTSARLCMLTTRKTGIVSVLPSDGCSSAARAPFAG